MFVHEAYLASYLSSALEASSETRPIAPDRHRDEISQVMNSGESLFVVETSNLVPFVESSAETPVNGIVEIDNALPSDELVADDELPDSFTESALNQPDVMLIEEVTTWSAVWRPFFSKATAQGFSDYIGEATGLSLRVSRSRVQGQYLVEVRHTSEAERLAADRLIVETTGYRPTDALQ